MSKDHAHAATPLEWTAAALGALLTVGTVGYLVREGIVGHDRAFAALVIEVDSVVAQQNGWLVAIDVHNRGRATAAAVRVTGELADSTGVVETSAMTLDYVPEGSSSGGALLFTRDPAEFQLDVRPTGYARP